MFSAAGAPPEFSSISLGPSAPAIAYCRTHRAGFLAELKEFIRFPSVSAQPEHADDLKRCAAWLAEHLRRIGMERVTVVPTRRSSHCLRRMVSRAGATHGTHLRTLRCPARRPSRRMALAAVRANRAGNDLYGRGASDDKGQLFAHMKAMESLSPHDRRAAGQRQVPLRRGRRNRQPEPCRLFSTAHRDALAADVAVLSDTRYVWRPIARPSPIPCGER